MGVGKEGGRINNAPTSRKEDTAGVEDPVDWGLQDYTFVDEDFNISCAVQWTRDKVAKLTLVQVHLLSNQMRHSTFKASAAFGAPSSHVNDIIMAKIGIPVLRIFNLHP